ncbi:MAG: metallophosphoesterase [Balneolaceae bacterium]|nr:metallophosphoesterase [Balneolaceae bacterium]
MRVIYLAILSLFVSACGTTGLYIEQNSRDWESNPPPENEETIYSVYLLGDAGAPDLENDPTLNLFERFLEEADENSAAIFLGDNIYNYGLPDSTHPRRDFYEQRLNAQLNTVTNYKGRVVFVPGNHDWNNGLEGGLETVNRQEKYIEEYLDRGNTFLPDNGFPGPHEIELMDDDEHPALRHDIRLVALDTHWWLHDYEKSYGDNGDFYVNDAGDVINELQDIVRDRKNDYLIVAAHHPLYSNESHGGYFPLKTHFTPPIFGSIYVLYRKLFGYIQDIPHHRYSAMADAFKGAFSEKEDVIYVSGHAHTLQYHKKTKSKRYNTHYLVSGSGSKTDYVANGKGANFAYGGNGFMILKFYTDGSVWTEAWAPNEDGNEGTLIYRTQVQEPNSAIDETETTENREQILANTPTTIAANKEYDRGGKLYRGLLGENRREMWSVEADFPVFDVMKVEGGLQPVRFGGRGQSNTLHLDGEDDKEFVLRSVDKQAGKVWDESLKKSFALEVAQDQFSMLNPYAALVVAQLAAQSGVYHTNPQYFVVPDDPLLGGYGDLMAGTLALFERKPDNDMSDLASVGRPEEVLSHLDFMREVDGDIDHRVDQKLFARSRLFDMLIADWDRHADQWRWGAFEPDDEQGKIYRPIPRDRDVALMKLNGLIPTLAKLGPFVQYQNFDKTYGHLKGMNQNSLGLTRRFTNQIDENGWVELAFEIKQSLTDEAIEEAVRAYPQPIFEEFGEETIEILKARRDLLPEIALEYATLINQVVTINGSHKRERVVINITNKDSLRVQVFKLSGKGKLREKYYDRTFSSDLTKEVRVYVMGGDDEFVLDGNRKSNIKLRLVGGSGEDVFVDENPGIKRNLHVYDTDISNPEAFKSNADFNLSDDPAINQYYYKNDFQWNSTQIGFFFAFNDDDGIFIGGGPKFVKHGFRKSPAQEHYIRANYAAITGAANIRYNGAWNGFTKNWNGNIDGKALLPESYRYFFGLGNDTHREEQLSSEFYRARLEQYQVLGKASINVRNMFSYFVGAGLQFTKIDDVEGESSILNEPRLGINPNIFSNQYYGQVTTGVVLNDIDSSANPKHGFRISLNSLANLGMNEASKSHLRLTGESAFYVTSPSKRQFTFAGRFGSEHIIGNFPFYEANTIGARRTIRGFNNQRFSGRTSLYTNAELRIELVDFYSYILGGKGGILTFVDSGRVWTDGEESDTWHKGYGGGVWFNVFDQFLISATYGTSGNENSFEIKAGFFF